MDELIEFIKSLNGINENNIYEHVTNFENLIGNIRVDGVKNIVINNRLNICYHNIGAYNINIITSHPYVGGLILIEVLVHDRYIRANILANGQFNSLTGIISNPKQSINIEKHQRFGKIVSIKTDNLIDTDDKCNIDWLLNLKPIKSARQ